MYCGPHYIASLRASTSPHPAGFAVHYSTQGDVPGEPDPHKEVPTDRPTLQQQPRQQPRAGARSHDL